MLGAPGAGGQMMYADPTRGLGWAYLTSSLSLYAIGDDPRYLALEQAVYECVAEVMKEARAEGRESSSASSSSPTPVVDGNNNGGNKKKET
jgi:hypothetical protein